MWSFAFKNSNTAYKYFPLINLLFFYFLPMVIQAFLLYNEFMSSVYILDVIFWFTCPFYIFNKGCFLKKYHLIFRELIILGMSLVAFSKIPPSDFHYYFIPVVCYPFIFLFQFCFWGILIIFVFDKKKNSKKIEHNFEINSEGFFFLYKMPTFLT